MCTPNTHVLIRSATPDDALAIARVRAEAVVHEAFYSGAIDVNHEIEYFLPRASGYIKGEYHPSHALQERAVYVAYHQTNIIGFIAGHRTTRMECTGELQWLFVLPEWQRRGIAAQLLAHLSDWFASMQATRVIVDSPPGNPTRAFYIKHGAQALDEHWLHWPNITSITQSAD
ncbi:MAG: GNAT family N-acetyltransferase [Phycisphaerales bacterium JB043]